MIEQLRKWIQKKRKKKKLGKIVILIPKICIRL